MLVGVAPQWREAFLAFAEDNAQPLPSETEAIVAWLQQTCLAKVG